MTTALTLSATEMARSSKDRAKRKEELSRELDEMSAVMVAQEGLLNHSQAALLLDITPARLTELGGEMQAFRSLGRCPLRSFAIQLRFLAHPQAETGMAGR
jgi:hypothetical protein